MRAEANPAWHLYPIRLNLEKLTVGPRSKIFRALRAENIGVNVHYIPVHLIRTIANISDTKAVNFPWPKTRIHG